MGDDVIMTSFKFFFQTIVHISNFIEPTNFVHGTNTQQYNVHLIIKKKVNLTDDEGHRRRSKVTKRNIQYKFYVFFWFLINSILSWIADKHFVLTHAPLTILPCI